ncbi:MAG: hypothetical protein K1X48_03225 [Burkholderiaceae bacterium]|nr:hypothetical protein [Burkholderiaceae bacterium]
MNFFEANITNEMMQRLEQMALHDLESAMFLMARLYWFSMQTFDHETSDAIDLWFFHKGRPSLLEDLKALKTNIDASASSIRHQDYRKQVTQWIENCQACKQE